MPPDGIVHHMKKQAGPNSLSLHNQADLEAFINHFDASVVGELGRNGVRRGECVTE